jgi:small-conductance mechanosensitive channel
MQQVIGLAAGLIGVIAYVPYVRDILKRRAKPERASWIIWSVQYTLLFFTQVTQHVPYALWLPGLQLAGVIVVCGLSFRYGHGKFDRQKVLLLLSVGIALLIWYLTKNAVAALLISIFIEAFGIALTSYKAYKDPASETLTLWALIGFAGVLGVVAVGMNGPLILYIYPIALAVMNFSVVAAQLLGRKRMVSRATAKA